ncbi:hypothetical protein [Pendulispora albinea]|uniref:DUF3011 domain-containing protein n=1 Tax=Pendulispora albinea TaxID=2741071 RepID=A0ABZ2LUW0_9BACT
MFRAVRGPATAAVVVFIAASFGARSTAAAAEGPTPWWIDPSSCSEWSTALARQITLACDAAARSCQMSAEKIATANARQITLRCGGGDHWTLEAHDGTGASLWHIEVRGEFDERVRAAALWVVRSDAAMAESPYDALPANTRIVTPSSAAPRTSRDPSRQHEIAPRTTSEDEPDTKTGFALAARSLFDPSFAYAAYGLGARIVDAGEFFGLIPRPLRLYLALAGEYGWTHVLEDAKRIRVHIGPGIAWTIPRTHDILALSLEAGLGVQRKTVAIDAGSVSEYRPLAYGQLGVTAYAPLRGSLRPFASAALGIMDPGLNLDASNAHFTVEIGAAWSAW